MLVPSELVGLWRADSMYGPGSQSSDVLFFFEDGTGRLDFHKPVLCNAWTFRWNLITERKLRIVGGLAFFHDKVIVTKPWVHNVEHSISVKTELTQRGDDMRVLRFSQRPISGLSDHFAFCRNDIDEFVEPDFSYTDNLS